RPSRKVWAANVPRSPSFTMAESPGPGILHPACRTAEKQSLPRTRARCQAEAPAPSTRRPPSQRTPEPAPGPDGDRDGEKHQLAPAHFLLRPDYPVAEAVGEPVGQQEEQADPRKGVQPVGQQEALPRQADDPRAQEDGGADAG